VGHGAGGWCRLGAGVGDGVVSTSVDQVGSFGSGCACSFPIIDSKKHWRKKTSANEVLEKSLGKNRAENAELLKKVQELYGLWGAI